MGLETTEGTGRGPAKRMWKSRGIGRGRGMRMVGWSWQSACVCVLFALQLLLLLFEWPHSWHIQHPTSYIQHPAYATGGKNYPDSPELTCG